jgi:parallel beta-helix repeat protein
MNKNALIIATFSIICFLLPNLAMTHELIEPQGEFPTPAPAEVLNAWHLYGTQEGEMDISTLYPAFDGVFNLYVTDHFSEWTNEEISNLICKIMDADSTNSEDLFPRIWDYFCFKDLNSSYGGVRFNLGGSTYTDIDLYCYNINDFTCPGAPSLICGYYSWYQSYTNDFYLGANNANEMNIILYQRFSHEFQHLCFAINGFTTSYNNINESLAKCAEHSVGSYNYYNMGIQYEQSYDASIYRGERCDPYIKYLVEELWMGYLFDAYQGNQGSIEDDLVYKWLRYNGETTNELSMNSLAGVLSGSEYSWVAGSTGSERLRSLFQYYAVAKFCNASEFGSEGVFGYGGSFSPVHHIGMFLDLWPPNVGAEPQLPVDCPVPGAPCGHSGTCGGSWNVRIVPPCYPLGEEIENTTIERAGIYKDGDNTYDPNDGDKSRDYIDVATYGTDYIIFQPDEYFQDGEYHEFHFSLEGEDEAPPDNSQVKVWAIGYSSDVDTLQLHPEDIVFIRPIDIAATGTECDFVVTDFGRSIKSVVVVISLVQDDPSDNTIEYFTYKYRYGVFKAEGSQTTWKGDIFVVGDVEIPTGASLVLDAGSKVHVAETDYSQRGADTNSIELNVSGTIDVNGTANNPVIIGSWKDSPSAGDWQGVRLLGTSASGSFDHCQIEHAYHGIKSVRPIQISNSSVGNCEVHGIYLEGSGANGSQISSCTANGNGSCGIMLNDCDNVTIGSCEANSNYHGIWLTSSNPGSVNHTSTKYNTSNGIRADNCFYEFSYCYVEDNDQQGMYLTNTRGTISNCKIWENSANGIYCVGSTCDPAVDHSKIEQNQVGVRVASGGCPKLGDTDLDVGQNNSIFNQPTYVYASPSYVLKAENCWWGTVSGTAPDPNKFKGNVDYFPYLSSDPVQYLASMKPEISNEASTSFSLAQNSPNPLPVAAATIIRYSIPRGAERVTLTVYDVSGRRVKTLVNDVVNGGEYSTTWDCRNQKGSRVVPGIYFYRLSVGTKSLTKKIVLIQN